MEEKHVTFINSWGIPVINYLSPNQGRRAQHPRRGRRAPRRPKRGHRALEPLLHPDAQGQGLGEQGDVEFHLGRRAQYPRRGRRAPRRPRRGHRAPGATTSSRRPGTRAWRARRRRAPPGTQSPKVGSGESLKSVFNNPMVGTIYSLVSSDVANLQPTSGSGNLSPTLGEEVYAPLWFRTSVLLLLFTLGSATKSW